MSCNENISIAGEVKAQHLSVSSGVQHITYMDSLHRSCILGKSAKRYFIAILFPKYFFKSGGH